MQTEAERHRLSHLVLRLREREVNSFTFSAQSHLSNYGNSSLAFNEREIYNKQNSKFNIISLKPKEVPDQIKQYPKLTL